MPVIISDLWLFITNLKVGLWINNVPLADVGGKCLITVFKCSHSTFVIERIGQIIPRRARQLNFSPFNTHLLFPIVACVSACVCVGVAYSITVWLLKLLRIMCFDNNVSDNKLEFQCHPVLFAPEWFSHRTSTQLRTCGAVWKPN